jgi:hypothetical protein
VRFQVLSSLYNLEADQKLGTGCDSCCIVGDIVERPTQHYLVTEVLNMWEVSMGGSHTTIRKHSIPITNLKALIVAGGVIGV